MFYDSKSFFQNHNPMTPKGAVELASITYLPSGFLIFRLDRPGGQGNAVPTDTGFKA